MQVALLFQARDEPPELITPAQDNTQGRRGGPDRQTGMQLLAICAADNKGRFERRTVDRSVSYTHLRAHET